MHWKKGYDRCSLKIVIKFLKYVFYHAENTVKPVYRDHLQKKMARIVYWAIMQFFFLSGFKFFIFISMFLIYPQKAMVNVELIHCTQTLKLVGTTRKGMTNGKQDRRPTSLTAQESDNVVHLGLLKVIQWFMRPTLPVSWATSPRDIHAWPLQACGCGNCYDRLDFIQSSHSCC